MKAVILAAGQSTRTYPLTLTKPKPLLRIANTPLLSHILDSVVDAVNEIIIIVGYKHEMIRSYFGTTYQDVPIRYVMQEKPQGTGHALLLARPYLTNDFVVMVADDLLGKGDVSRLIMQKHSMLVAKVDNHLDFGVVKMSNNMLDSIQEKPSKASASHVSTACFHLTKHIFDCIAQTEPSLRGEIELPDAIMIYKEKFPIICIKAEQYCPVGFPWDVLKADALVRQGDCPLGEGTVVSGSVVDSSVGDYCNIEGQVKNSIIMDGAVIKEGSIVEHSIIGERVIFEGIVKGQQTTSKVKDQEKNAGVFGCAIGDGTIVQQATIAPGVKIWPQKKVAGQVEEDVK